jgi:hypothetical protein
MECSRALPEQKETIMKSELWDERYAKTDYLYSDRPNEFMKRHFEALTPNGARVLLPGDGDGRNGLWLAKQGFQVEAFDYSKVASEKANRRAREAWLAYSSRHQDVNDWVPEKSQFDFVEAPDRSFDRDPEARRLTHHSGVLERSDRQDFGRPERPRPAVRTGGLS